VPPYRAHAKINLGLRVLAREDGGYHQIETVFCSIDLADTLEIARSSQGIALHVSGADLGASEDNLVHRAADAYFLEIGEEAAVRIDQEKRIPHGAGLGGGSSDAATTLRALDALHGDRVGLDRLLALGHDLGSDVPFFLGGAPFALAWGRGERMLRLDPPPAAELVIAVPAERVATAEAYASLGIGARVSGLPPRLLRASSFAHWADIARIADNDFTRVVVSRLPVVGDLVRALASHGAVAAQMTGSGSAVFGVFGDADQADRAADALSARLPDVTVVRSRTVDAEPGFAVDPPYGPA
jgi:4-diphosphocytidyl-2-C-methyl-D-erythritol kinase